MAFDQLTSDVIRECNGREARMREAAQRLRASEGKPLYPDEAREIAELLDPQKKGDAWKSRA